MEKTRDAIYWVELVRLSRVQSCPSLAQVRNATSSLRMTRLRNMGPSMGPGLKHTGMTSEEELKGINLTVARASGPSGR